MTKRPYSVNQIRGPAPTPPVRGEPQGDDDRPFAEIRRNLDDVLRILFLHRWAFFIPFCIVASGAFILSLYYPRTYRATSSFERRNDPIMVDLPNAAGAASFRYFRSTMTRDLTSVSYMTEVVENLGLTKDFSRNADESLTEHSIARRNALARSLGSRIYITTQSPSEHVDIIRITYTGPDPTIGTRLLDEVKKTYIRRTSAWMREFLESQRAYVAGQLAEALEEVKDAQRVATRLRLENPYINPQNPGVIPEKLSQLEIERRELSLRRREHEAELSSERQLLAALEPWITRDRGSANQGDSLARTEFVSPQQRRLMNQLHASETKIETLRTTRGMTDRHPEIAALLANHTALQNELNQQLALDRNVVVTNDSLGTAVERVPANAPEPWHGERARLLAKISTVTAKIKDMDISLESNQLSLDKLQQAKKDVYLNQEKYADSTARLVRSRRRHGEVASTLARLEPAIKAMEQDRLVKFSQGPPARGGSRPINPRANTIVLLALVAGIVAGAIFVVLAEVLDNIYRSSSRVSRGLGLPILETIDEIITSEDRRRNLVRKTVFVPVLLALGLGLTGITGSMAYLSIQRPWTYKQIREIPQAAIQLLVGTQDTTNTESQTTTS